MSEGFHPNFQLYCSPLPQFEESHFQEFTSQFNLFPITELDFELHRGSEDPKLALSRTKSDSKTELPFLENCFVQPTFFTALPNGSLSDEDFETINSNPSILDGQFRRKVITKPKEIKPPVINKIGPKGCGCLTSNCLRRYCKCFNGRGYCGEGCGCVDCFNTPEYEKERQVVIQKTKEICKNSFLPKIVTTSQGLRINAEGCHCKSGCRSKHCLCAKNGVGCSPICRCKSCINEKIELEASEVKKYFRNPSRIKAQIVIKVSPTGQEDTKLQTATVAFNENKKTVVLFPRPETETRISNCSAEDSLLKPNNFT